MERLQIPTPTVAKTLEADWQCPPDARKAIIQLSGWKGDSLNSSRTARIAEMVTQAGFGSLRLNLTGHGRSGGSIEDFDLEVARRDVQCVMSFLVEKFGIGKFGLIGSSVGAGVALHVAANDNRVVWLVTLAARWNYDDTKPTLYDPNKKLRSSGLSINWAGELGRINVPTLILHGKDDTTVNPMDSGTLKTAIASSVVAFEIIDCAHHITGEGLEQALYHISNWLEHL